MFTVQKMYKVFSFSELSEKAKDKVRQWYLNDDLRTDIFTEDCLYRLGELFPNSDLKVEYSLGYCQGDGLNIYGDLRLDDVMEYIKDNFTEDRVYHYDSRETGEVTNIVDYTDDNGDECYYYEITLDNGEIIRAEEANEFEVERDDLLPMWSVMWSFRDSCDDWWLEEQDGIRIMSECGFRVYNSYKYGYFFGIDGAGYSFYDKHWIPLYKKRGLKWHDEED